MVLGLLYGSASSLLQAKCLCNASALTVGTLKHAGHDNYCMPDLDPFPVLLERINGIEAIRQKSLHKLNGMKTDSCWSTIAKSSLEY